MKAASRLKDIFEAEMKTLSSKPVSYTHLTADFYADNISIRADGTEFDYYYNGKSAHIVTQMIGMFNVFNVMAAISVCLKIGLEINDILKALKEYKGVKGRCEIIPTGKDFTVICDYAHTPDAIENILSSVKEYTSGDLICLFGCGGNKMCIRDRNIVI